MLRTGMILILTKLYIALNFEMFTVMGSICKRLNNIGAELLIFSEMLIHLMFVYTTVLCNAQQMFTSTVCLHPT